MKNKLLSILLHPLFIAITISFVIIYFLPDYFKKYKVELIYKELFGRDHRVYYKDLNNDNNSEKIFCYNNNLGNACYEIHSAKGEIIDQWNFLAKHSSTNKYLRFFDINNNGYKEIYLFTKKRDSLFLNIEEPFVKDGIHNKNIFIEVINEHNNKFKILTDMFGVDEINANGEKEIFFTLRRGFSGNPRNAYKYNLKKNQIYKSPHLTNPSSISHIIDLDSDGTKEILLRNLSTCNTIDSIYTKRSDYSSWLMVLNNDLSFRFTPIEFKIPFSSLETIPYKNNKGEFQLLCLLNSTKEELSTNKLLIFSNTGKLLQEKILPFGWYRIFSESNKKEFTLINKDNGHIQTFSFEFKELASFIIEPKSIIYPLDIDENSKKEWLEISNDQNRITIYQNNFKDPVKFQISNFDDDKLHHGLKKISEKENEIYFQKGNYHYVYKYDENPMYIFRYLIYFGVFLFVLGVVWLILKGQKIRVKKQRAIEKKISELQIKTIKNQVDPHFVFNAVNTISEMVLTGDKLEADNFICQFSDFMRLTLNSSDKISHSLKNEINYSENYIKLQQIHHNNSFDYEINIDKNVKQETTVPKHVIYSYIENSVKHGLASRLEKGFLQLNITQKDKTILIVVEDNGDGLESKTDKKNSTGSGLKIMEKMYKLYYKLYKRRITHTLIELIDDKNNKSGIRVEIRISE